MKHNQQDEASNQQAKGPSNQKQANRSQDTNDKTGQQDKTGQHEKVGQQHGSSDKKHAGPSKSK